MKVVLFQQHPFELWNPPPWVATRLQQRFPEARVVHPANLDDLAVQLRDADIAIGSTLPLDLLATASPLKWLHSPAAAVHHYMVPEFQQRDVILTNGRSTFAAPVAEHVIALIFALARRLPACFRLQNQRTWGQQQLWDTTPRPRGVQGATLGLVGLGAIGREVVVRAKALGMKAVAVRRDPGKPTEGLEEVLPAAEIGQLLAQSDFVVLAAPVTAATRHILSAGRLAQMKSSAYLINVGRGALIDEAALAKSLQSQQIAGAALDVFEEEPLPAHSPLWELENLIITPHCAGFIENLWERHLDLIIENFRRFVAGEAMLGIVDKSNGY